MRTLRIWRRVGDIRAVSTPDQRFSFKRGFRAYLENAVVWRHSPRLPAWTWPCPGAGYRKCSACCSGCQISSTCRVTASWSHDYHTTVWSAGVTNVMSRDYLRVTLFVGTNVYVWHFCGLAQKRKMLYSQTLVYRIVEFVDPLPLQIANISMFQTQNRRKIDSP